MVRGPRWLRDLMESVGNARNGASTGPYFRPVLSRSTSCVVVRLRKPEKVFIVLSLGFRQVSVTCRRLQAVDPTQTYKPAQ